MTLSFYCNAVEILLLLLTHKIQGPWTKYHKLLWFSKWGFAITSIYIILRLGWVTRQLFEFKWSIWYVIHAIWVIEIPCIDNGWPLSESFWLAHSVEDVFVHLIIVVLGCDHLIAWSACVRWDVDTSMFLRKVASPETLNA